MTKTIYKIDEALKKQLKNIPDSCGIYMMADKKGEVIYIGKALNLKARIRSYFNTASWKERPKLYFMMPKVKEIKTKITRSEKEALILEANLVNKYQPKYNVTLKDDKKFPWLMITYDEDYPRVVPIRDVAGFKTKYPDTKNKFFGPYSDSGAMWETYKILKEGFQLRLRRKPLFQDRPCMNYHIGLCSGPCQKLISYEDYHKIVKQVEDFLLGKYNIVLKSLEKQMKEASEKLDYEKAAKLRDTVQKIKIVLEKQFVVSADHTLNQDVFACDYQDNFMVLELILVREGKVITFESLTFDVPQKTSPEEAFEEAIKQYYIRTQDENIPSEIIVQFDLKEKRFIEDWLSSRLNNRSQKSKVKGQKKSLVTMVCPKKSKKLELVKMAEQNAKLALQRVLISKTDNIETLPAVFLKKLQDELYLKNYPNHIECFDISHLSGTGTVGSMICFINGQPEKSLYRKFKIKTLLNEIDDYKAMKEIVSRRYKSLIDCRDAPAGRLYGDNKLPDLIIIDGGKGQLNAAREALESIDIDLQKIDLISLAKKREEIFKPDKKDSIFLDRKSQALFLVQRIRNEAHRFAITYQRKKRKKDAFESALEKIPGLGPARVKRLMNYFGSVKNIQESDLDTFANALGHNKDKAKDLWEKIKVMYSKDHIHHNLLL